MEKISSAPVWCDRHSCARKWQTPMPTLIARWFVPAVCAPNEISKVHRQNHRMATSAMNATSGALTRVHAPDAINDSIFIHKTKAHIDERHRTSPYSSRHSDTLRFTCRRCRTLTFHLSPSWHWPIPFTDKWTEKQTKTKTFGWIGYKQKTLDACTQSKHQWRWRIGVHYGNTGAKPILIEWIDSVVVWHFSKHRKRLNRKTNFHISTFEQITHARTHERRCRRRRNWLWVAWHSDFYCHWIRCNFDVVTAASNGFRSGSFSTGCVRNVDEIQYGNFPICRKMAHVQSP